MDYLILIITRNRVEGCYQKTLTMLKENHIPRELIHLVVHNKEQKKMYEDGIPSDLFNSIIVTNKNQGVNGQLNWIFKKYVKGQKILKLDDDITCIYELQADKLVKSYNLKEIIRRGFELCLQNDLKL